MGVSSEASGGEAVDRLDGVGSVESQNSRSSMSPGNYEDNGVNLTNDGELT